MSHNSHAFSTSFSTISHSALEGPLKIFLVISIIGLIVIVPIIICFIVISNKKKSKKISEDFLKTAELFASENRENKDEIICQYCGSKFSINISKCPNCGASVKRRK